MERLHVGTHQSVSQSVYTDSVEPVVGAANVNPLGSFGQDSKPVITTLPEWSAGLVTSNNYTWQDMGPEFIQKRAVTATCNCYFVTLYFKSRILFFHLI